MKCIWCLKEDPEVSFIRDAHIFPQSLGGKRKCKNVCDSCNSYFGTKSSKAPSVEIALKEPLNISRLFILTQIKKDGVFPRSKSEYFNYDLKRQVLRPKQKYRLITDFQILFARQFRRGIYKIFLEQRSESIGDAFDSKFDFIREFARWNLGDCPAFYCHPRVPAVFVAFPDIKNPVIRFTESSLSVEKQFGFYSYYFFSHTFAMPVIRHYEITLNNYIEHLKKSSNKLYSRITEIKSIEDIDFTFNFMQEK